MNPIIIAIDGTSASGKGTIAKQLAEHFQYRHIDTGAMYRVITYSFLKNQINFLDIDAVKKQLLNIFITFEYDHTLKKSFIFYNDECVEDKIRNQEINEMVSKVAAIKEVREFAVYQQQLMGVNKKIVMDGRDIGTRVFPNAEVKFFVTAQVEVRAKRRFEEMKKNKMEVTYEQVLNNLIQRDEIDSNRLIDPLKKTADAILVDNTFMNIQEQFDFCYGSIKKLMNHI